jgi:2-C-methyl-D-erythritol 2,4-cyclodiphosphate synthase
VRDAGFGVANIDSSLILSAPKIGPFAIAIRTRVAELLAILPDCVGLKAKTPEGLGLENTAVAHVVVLLEERQQETARSKKKKKK